MKNIRNIAQKIEDTFALNSITKFSYRVTEKQKRELNAENGEFSLLRTLFDNNVVITAYKDCKVGTVSGNDFSDCEIENLVKSAISSAESAVEDPNYDIAPKEEAEVFAQGIDKPDFDLFFDKVKELISDIHDQYPKIQIMNIIGEYIQAHTIYRNSNGTDFENSYGLYSVSLEFAGHDGNKTSNLDYCGFETVDLKTKLIDQSSVRYHLENAQKQLEQISLSGKFEGDVIFTPECFAQFVMYTAGAFLSDKALLDGTSIWKDSIGKKVASDKLTITLKSSDPRIICSERYTSDGFKTEDLPIIENGILKNYTIGLFTSNKTGMPVSKNSSADLVIQNQSDSFDLMVKSIDKGIILGGFSGGKPSGNGDFSGVAKNSYYIEKGQVQGAVSEIMVNGNLANMLMNIKAISSEVVLDGTMVVPYVQVQGIVISGK